MPILVDLSQVAVSNITADPRSFNNGKDTELTKHMILNSIRLINLKFGKTYGKIVLCCDDKTNWRKQIFPYYKYTRKKEKEVSPYDWNAIYETIDSTVHDIRENFHYKVIRIDKLEGDDVIAALAMGIRDEEILIISSDKDFGQLHKYDNVKQYCLKKKEFIKIDDPEQFLFELIVRGDRSDGIPNIKSVEDCFVKKIRQSAIRKAFLDEFSSPERILAEKEYARRFKLNRALIDFNSIPRGLVQQVLDEYRVPPKGNINKMLNYFAEQNMINLFSSISHF